MPTQRGPGGAPFRPPPRPAPDGPSHTVRLQDGARCFEVSGSAPFVRQVLDEMPALLSRLRGEPPPKPASITMPAPPADDEPDARLAD